jgi:hypothetical protein
MPTYPSGALSRPRWGGDEVQIDDKSIRTLLDAAKLLR